MIRSANPTDADELLAIRRDAIMGLAEEYGRVEAERWATAAHPDRAAKAIATNSVCVAELGSKVVGSPPDKPLEWAGVNRRRVFAVINAGRPAPGH